MHTNQNAVNKIAVRRFYRPHCLFTMRSERDLTTLAKFSQPIIGPPLYPSTRSRVLNYAGKAIFIITLLVVKLLLWVCADGVLPRIWIGCTGFILNARIRRCDNWNESWAHSG